MLLTAGLGKSSYLSANGQSWDINPMLLRAGLGKSRYLSANRQSRDRNPMLLIAALVGKARYLSANGQNTKNTVEHAKPRVRWRSAGFFQNA